MPTMQVGVGSAGACEGGVEDGDGGLACGCAVSGDGAACWQAAPAACGRRPERARTSGRCECVARAALRDRRAASARQPAPKVRRLGCRKVMDRMVIGYLASAGRGLDSFCTVAMAFCAASSASCAPALRQTMLLVQKSRSTPRRSQWWNSEAAAGGDASSCRACGRRGRCVRRLRAAQGARSGRAMPRLEARSAGPMKMSTSGTEAISSMRSSASLVSICARSESSVLSFCCSSGTLSTMP